LCFYVSIWEQDIGNECMHPLCYCWFLTSKIFYRHFFSVGQANKWWMCSSSVGALQVTSSSLLGRFIFQWKLHIYASIHESKALSCNSMLCNQWPLHTSMLKIHGSLWTFLRSRILFDDPSIVACDPSYLEQASCKDFVEAIYLSEVSKKYKKLS
jgi:hypothetical protein